MQPAKSIQRTQCPCTCIWCGSNNSTLFGFGDIIGFQKSNDKGITWTKVNTNNLNDTITNIVMDPDMDFIYVSGYSEKGFLSVY
jgi:hypothetical protein